MSERPRFDDRAAWDRRWYRQWFWFALALGLLYFAAGIFVLLVVGREGVAAAFIPCGLWASVCLVAARRFLRRAYGR